MGRAALPMYDLPELREATDAWWQGLSRHLKKAGMRYLPDGLERPKSLSAHWLDPTLIFSQTCGYPLTHALSEHLHLIGTPCYSAPGCHGPRYCSLVVVAAAQPARRIADLRGMRCVYNGRDSQSGYNALRALIAPQAQNGRFFSTVQASGNHRDSLLAVGRGQADVCAVDCVTHALLARYAPDTLAGTRVLTQTPTAPGLPYVTASVLTVAEMRAGVAAAFADPDLREVRAALLLDGIELLERAAYREILNMEAFAVYRGYPELK